MQMQTLYNREEITPSFVWDSEEDCSCCCGSRACGTVSYQFAFLAIAFMVVLYVGRKSDLDHVFVASMQHHN